MSSTSDNTASICEQFGVSPKALRLYERLGMLVPPRNASGWRSYGPAEIERLHAILSLKQLGLPLARIAELLRNGQADLQALLDTQEAMLKEVQRETERALTLLRIAKVHLGEAKSLAPGELAGLVRQIAQTVLPRTAEIDALTERIYTPAQRVRVSAASQSDETIAALSQLWTRIDTLLARRPPADPLSEEALAIGRGLAAHYRAASNGDAEIWNNSYRFWQEAAADPEIVAQMPRFRERSEFISAMFAELNRRGELSP